MIRAIVASACFALAFPALAEIEKIAIPGENGLAFRWWPRLTPPKGWQQDLPVSFENGVNALTPVGQTFADAPTVMYAKAVFKARVPDVTSLAEMIVRDKKDFLNNVPDVVIRPTGACCCRSRTRRGPRRRMVPVAIGSAFRIWKRASFISCSR